MPAPERTELAEAVSAGAPAARVCGRDPAPGWGSRAEVMRLQRAAGNRAVAREGRRRLLAQRRRSGRVSGAGATLLAAVAAGSRASARAGARTGARPCARAHVPDSVRQGIVVPEPHLARERRGGASDRERHHDAEGADPRAARHLLRHDLEHGLRQGARWQGREERDAQRGLPAVHPPFGGTGADRAGGRAPDARLRPVRGAARQPGGDRPERPPCRRRAPRDRTGRALRPGVQGRGGLQGERRPDHQGRADGRDGTGVRDVAGRPGRRGRQPGHQARRRAGDQRERGVRGLGLRRLDQPRGRRGRVRGGRRRRCARRADVRAGHADVRRARRVPLPERAEPQPGTPGCPAS